VTQSLSDDVIEAVTEAVGEVESIEVPWDNTPWSATWRLTTAVGGSCYLKRTPRSRLEVSITERLHEIAPEVVPRVLVGDLVPDAEMRWFILGDVGDCDQDDLDPDVAIPAVEALGGLQRRAATAEDLASLLPDCRATHLFEAAGHEHAWALTGNWRPRERDRIDSAWDRILQHSSVFEELAHALASLPDTVVHADFWSRHISRPPIHIIDWADAVWGPGGVSIVRLLASESGRLDGQARSIWAAFARGWQASEMSAEYIAASDVAGTVIALVVDHRVTESWGQGPTQLKGLIGNIEGLADELERL
jgi:hypothetical protein